MNPWEKYQVAQPTSDNYMAGEARTDAEFEKQWADSMANAPQGSEIARTNTRIEATKPQPVVESAKPWERYQATPTEPTKQGYKPTKIPLKSKAETSNNPLNPAFYNDMSLSNVPQNLGNLVAGGVRGSGSIGSSLLLPWDAAKAAIAGTGITGAQENNANRREGIDAGLKTMGADPTSGLYKTGKIGAEIAGTADLGTVLGIAAKVGNATPSMVNMLRSGGFGGGGAAKFFSADTAKRAAAGATLAGTQGALVDPENAGNYAVMGGALPTGIRAAGAVGKLTKGAVKQVLGATTGAGSEAIGGAYQAGKKGSKAYVDNVKGNVAFDEVVTQAKEGIQKMYADKSNLYRSGMIDISKDKTVIPFAPIEQAVNKIGGMGSYKGVQINKNASGMVDDLMEKVNEWKSLNPAEYHTPEGLDALKKAIGDIRDTTQYGTASRKAADDVYNAVKNEITKQAPTYSKVMKDYADASEHLKTIEKTLSLNPNASVDTTVRKLQSVLRNNATTNYGNRAKTLDALEKGGNVDLRAALSGQALNSWMPRGMTGAIEKAGLPLLAYMEPTTLALAPLTSPRLVGGAAYNLGRMSGKTNDGLRSLLSSPNQAQIQQQILKQVPLTLNYLNSRASQQ